MTWARLEDSIYDHPKLARVSLAAGALFVYAIAWSARHRTDGLVPIGIVTSLARGDHGLPQELLAQGLFEPQSDAIRIHDFAQYNPTAKQVADRRKLQRIRMAKYRSGDALQTRIVTRHSGEVTTSPSAPSRALRQKPRSKALPTAPKLSADATSTDHAASFSQFWEAYPPRNGRRDKKAQAYAAWRKLAPDTALVARILLAVKRYARENPFPVDAVRYLVHRRWEDEADVAYVASRPPRPLSPAATIPDEKPIRSPEAIATVRDVLEKLPFMRGRL